MNFKVMRKGLLAAVALCFSLGFASVSLAENLTVEVNNVKNNISYPFFGVNYVAYWDDIQGSAASKEALKRSGIQLIRFPGGAPAEWYDWADPYRDGWSKTSTVDLWNYAKDIPAALLLQTNNTTNHFNDPSGTHAADWVTHTVNNGIEAPFWEVGNEPDIHLTKDYDWTAFQPYIDKFNEHAAAMKARKSSIKVFGPVATNAWYWWGLHSLDMFLNKTGNKFGSGRVDGVSLHWYPGPGTVTNYDQIKALPQDWQRNYDYIRSVITANDTRNLPVFVTETNAATPASVPAGDVSMTMASALANADLLGAMRNSGVQSVSLFGAIHNVNDNYGFLYGFNDARAADLPTPTYYIFPIWTKSGNKVVNVTGVTDPANTLSAYASKKTSSNVQVLVINKTASARTANLSFTGFNPAGGNVQVYELKPSAGGSWDKDAYYNGVLMPSVTSGTLPAPFSYSVPGSTFSRSVPGYSITLFDFTASTATDTAQYNFENGQLHGFYQTGGATLSNSTAQKYAGSASMKMDINGNGSYLAQKDNPSGISAGTMITFRVWVPSGANLKSIQPFVQDANWTWTGAWRDYASLTKNAWNTVTVTVPSYAATPITRIGVEAVTSAAWTGSIYIDSIDW
jgi:hypothetical protein